MRSGISLTCWRQSWCSGASHVSTLRDRCGQFSSEVHSHSVFASRCPLHAGLVSTSLCLALCVTVPLCDLGCCVTGLFVELYNAASFLSCSIPVQRVVQSVADRRAGGWIRSPCSTDVRSGQLAPRDASTTWECEEHGDNLRDACEPGIQGDLQDASELHGVAAERPGPLNQRNLLSALGSRGLHNQMATRDGGPSADGRLRHASRTSFAWEPSRQTSEQQGSVSNIAHSKVAAVSRRPFGIDQTSATRVIVTSASTVLPVRSRTREWCSPQHAPEDTASTSGSRVPAPFKMLWSRGPSPS